MTGTIRDDDSNESRLAPALEGQLVADKYVAGPTIGVGGMGVVIAAKDTVLDRKVTIKFLLPSLAHSERAVRRFVREARAASRITGEHVARIQEIGRLPDGTPFIVMEYLQGRDLKDMLAEGGPLPVGQAVDYLLQAMEAVAEGHRSDVVHRDLKPSNLFVTKRVDGTEIVKVLDFGIAKTREPDGVPEAALTGSDDTRLGSPSYMSPEQLEDPRGVDARSDVWAMGVTLYELITNQYPFQGENYTQLVLSITSRTPEPPSKRRPDLSIPSELDGVVMRCLEKNGALRYATASELAAALAPFGSADARASLARVRRIAAPQSEPIDRTTTLPGVAARPRLSAPPGRLSPLSRRARVVLSTSVGLCAVAIVGIAWERGVSQNMRAAISSAKTPPIATTRPAAPSLSPSSDPTPSNLLPSAHEPSAPPAATARAKLPRVLRASSIPKGTAPSAALSAVAAEPSSSPEARLPESSEGRSPLIERLIEKRR